MKRLSGRGLFFYIYFLLLKNANNTKKNQRYVKLIARMVLL